MDLRLPVALAIVLLTAACERHPTPATVELRVPRVAEAFWTRTGDMLIAISRSDQELVVLYGIGGRDPFQELAASLLHGAPNRSSNWAIAVALPGDPAPTPIAFDGTRLIVGGRPFAVPLPEPPLTVRTPLPEPRVVHQFVEVTGDRSWMLYVSLSRSRRPLLESVRVFAGRDGSLSRLPVKAAWRGDGALHVNTGWRVLSFRDGAITINGTLTPARPLDLQAFAIVEMPDQVTVRERDPQGVGK